MRNIDIVLPIILIVALGVISTILFFPGFMSFDSITQYSQAIGASPITNAHPPITTYLWGFLIKFAPTPGTLLIFHQSMYWGSILLFAYSIADRAISRSAIVVLIGLWPPLFILSMHLWKDAGMMSALALAVAALAMHSKNGMFRWLMVATAALFYATAIRYNAITGTAPLLAFVAWRGSGCLSKDVRTRISTTIALLAVLLVAFGGGLGALNRHAREVPQLGTIFVWDMAAISIDQKKDLIPPYLTKVPGPDFIARITSHFSPNANYPVFSEVSPYPPSGTELWLVADWMKVVLNNLGSYLTHRVHVFSAILNTHGPIYYPFHPGIDQNTYGIKFYLEDFVTREALPVFSVLSTLTLYRIWPYFVLASLLAIGRIYMAVVHRWRTGLGALMVVTALSGVLIEVPLFIFATAADYRYSIWMVFSTMLATIMFWVEAVSPVGRVVSVALGRRHDPRWGGSATASRLPPAEAADATHLASVAVEARLVSKTGKC